METNVGDDDSLQNNIHNTSSFVENLPPARREVEELHSLLQVEEGHPTPTIEWSPITISPINEYNIEWLFTMAFPNLFPKGKASFKQQPMKEVKLHEYVLHLLKYHDNRFG